MGKKAHSQKPQDTCLIICRKEVPPAVLVKSRTRTPDHLLVSLTELSAKCAIEVLQEPTVLDNSNENLVAVEPGASKPHVTETESDILNHPEVVKLKKNSYGNNRKIY